MVLSSVYVCLLLISAFAKASTGVVRRVGVEANGRAVNDRMSSGAWSQTTTKSKSSQGLLFWHTLRKKLEAKRKDLVSSDVRESLAATRRDLLWQAVREVDYRFLQKTPCKFEEGTTYVNDAVFLQGHTSHTKSSIASARECGLMCAADSLEDHIHNNLACKSFTYNKTAHECEFFNFVQQARGATNNDACCTSGPPCDLDIMREEIQAHFHAKFEEMMHSQKGVANQLNAASKLLADTQKHTEELSLSFKKSAAQARQHRLKVDGGIPTQAVHTHPKAEGKWHKVEGGIPTLAEHESPKARQEWHKVDGGIHTLSKVERDMSTPKAEKEWHQVEGGIHTLSKVERDMSTPQVEQAWHKVEGGIHTLSKVERDMSTPKVEQEWRKVEGGIHTSSKVERDMSTPKVEQEWRKVEGGIHTLSKVERDMSTPKVEQEWHKVEGGNLTQSKVERNVVTHAERLLPKEDQYDKDGQKTVTQSMGALEKVEHNVVIQAEPASPKVEVKVNAVKQTSATWFYWCRLFFFACLPILTVILARWFIGILNARGQLKGLGV